jgi:hypothetical protein
MFCLERVAGVWGKPMENREVDGFQISAEAISWARGRQVHCLASGYARQGRSKAIQSDHCAVFASLETAQAAAVLFVHAITFVSVAGVPSPLIYEKYLGL